MQGQNLTQPEPPKGQLEVKPNLEADRMEAYITFPLGTEPKLVATLAISSFQKDKEIAVAWRQFLKQFLERYVASIGGKDIKYGDLNWSGGYKESDLN